MLGAFTVPIIVTFLLFPFVALLVFIPFAFRSYRAYGQLGFVHSFVFYSFVLYALALIFFVTLPLPMITPDFCARHGTSPQLQLFDFIAELRRAVPHLTFRRVVTNGAVLHAFFNVLFFVPLGFYLHYYFRRGFLVTALLGFAVTLALELTQLTGNWGIYPCSYRLFDVDDLMLNTFGAVLGYLVVPVLAFLPKPVTVVAGGLQRVSLARRTVALAIDAVTVAVAPLVAYVAVFGVLYLAYGYRGGLPENGPLASLLQFAVGLIAFVLVPLRWRGYTPGKFIVGIKVVGPNNSPITLGMILTRYAMLVGPLTLFSLLAEASDASDGQLANVLTAASRGWFGIVLVNLLIVALLPDHNTLGGLLSRTKNVVANDA